MTQEPDPSAARTVDDYVRQLRLLKAWVGNPSITELTRRVHDAFGRAGRPRGEWPVRSTVGRCFEVGRPRLNTDLVVAVVRALCADDPDTVLRWQQALWAVLRGVETAAFTTVLDRLPSDLVEFTGRDDLLAAAVRLLDPPTTGGRSPVGAVFEGMPGVGKTTLAVHLAHRLLAGERTDRPVLVVNLRGFDPSGPPAEPGAVLDAFLRVLGVAPNQIPHSLDERAARYRSLLADRHAVVLLDNAQSAEQVRPLLAADPTCRTLITSRRALRGLAGVGHLTLAPFTPCEALELLGRSAGPERVGSDLATAQRIAELLGHLPLALSVVGGHMRDHPDWRLTDYVEPLTTLALENGVRAAFVLSDQAMPAGARQLLRLLALHPGEDFEVDAAGALAGQRHDHTREHLDMLVAAHLLQQHAAGRYRLHDLIRAYATERVRLDEPASRTRQAVARLLRHYRHTAARAMDLARPHSNVPRPHETAPEDGERAFATVDDARRWLVTERANLIATAAMPDAPEHAIEMSAILGLDLAMAGLCDQARYLHEAACAAAHRLGDLAAEAGAQFRLGQAALVSGRHTEARDQLQQARSLCHRVGDVRGEARALRLLGDVWRRLSEYTHACECHEQALDLYHRLGDRQGQASTVRALGEVFLLRGEYARAREHYEHGLALYGDAYEACGRAGALWSLGGVSRLLGEYAAALGYYERALAAYRDLGDRQGEAWALWGLGDVARSTGEYARARAHLAATRAICREDGYRSAEAWVLQSLGETDRATGDHAASRRHLEAALTLLDESGERDGQVETLNALAETLCEVGEHERAVELLRRALSIADAIQYRRGKARALVGLGQFHRDLGDPDRAYQHWTRALELYDALGVPEAAHLRARIPDLPPRSRTSGHEPDTALRRSFEGRVP